MSFDLVSLVFGLATLASVMMLGFILSAQNTRIAGSMHQLNKTMSDWLLMQVKDRRAAKTADIHIENPLHWITQQCGIAVSQQQRVIDSACAVDLLSPDGCRVVVSTLDRDSLLKAIAPMSKGVGAKVVEPLLGRKPKTVEPVVRDLANAGEFFDVEAGQVGQLLGVHWGQPSRLYFYAIPLK